jgi:adenosylcobinamide-GDP ribazoletransferase
LRKLQLTDLQPPDRLPRQDNGSSRPAPTGPRLLDDFVMGLRFFSRLPSGDSDHEPPNLSRMAPAMAFTSIAIGFLPALAMAGFAWLGTPALFAAAIGVALLVIVTGAMPEDALADAADGLFGGATVERRLEIMKDSRHGTYGVAAIALYLILRVVAYGALAAVNPLAAAGVMLGSGILARSGALWLSVELPSAREGGSSATAGRVTRQAFAIGAAFAVVLTFALAGPFAGILGVAFALLAAGGTAVAWVWCCRKLVGGQTGDLIGALHALIEVAALTMFMIFA